MKIYLVMDETHFYQPNFVARFIEQTEEEVVGAALVTKVPAKNNISEYLLKHWYYLKLSEMFKLVFKSTAANIFDLVSTKNRGGNFYSVKSVYNFFKIDWIEVRDNINQEIYLRHIQAKHPDVLISSNSLYFGEKILEIPAICAINRHSALLPSYGGLFPVLQAFAHGEAFTGASIHTMEKKIDSGKVLAQKKIAIGNNTIAQLYKKCFEVSVDATLEALRKIKKNDFSQVLEKNSPSYYSFPTEISWKNFRKRKGRFV